ncbi:hypothetical protein N7G274_004589 [Stereocaulon virgatum]|uniref:Uncharacterized protein n=1 Tax=Stereocaulon virgatum TaxID=373712 RepID=A0ABR4ADP0_9LECA
MDDHPNNEKGHNQLKEELPDPLPMADSPLLVEDAGIDDITPPEERSSKDHIHPSELHRKLEGVLGLPSSHNDRVQYTVHAPPSTPDHELFMPDQAFGDATQWGTTLRKETVPEKEAVEEEWEEYDPSRWESGNSQKEEQRSSTTDPQDLEEVFPLLDNARTLRSRKRDQGKDEFVRACRDFSARAAHEDGFLDMDYKEGDIFRVMREELTDDGNCYMLIFDTKASSNRRGRVDSGDFEYYFPENEKNKNFGSVQ